VFCRTAERKMERALITQYESDLVHALTTLTPASLSTAIELAGLPESIRGFGHVKEAAATKAASKRASLLKTLDGLNMKKAA
jgi:indolepyruvate ferredoxin oxidoreductase